MLMGEMLRECGVPRDVYQVVPGYGETGAALVDEVDFVMFTGSAATGRKVMERAARTLTPFALELGGKDPMIICADADLERASNAAVHYSMQNAGQTCVATERVYVEEPIYDEFVRLVTDKVNALRQGEPGGPGSTDLGAVIHPPQSDIVERHVNDARERGARVLTGGNRRDEHGHYFEPTVLADVDHSMECMRDETFGPTVPIMKVTDADEAVRLANDSSYGLQASVWTSDAAEGRAARAPRRGRRRDRQRRPGQLPGLRASDGRLEGVRARHPPRRRGHPQVHEDADAARHELRAAEAGPAHDAVRLAPHRDRQQAAEVGVRARSMSSRRACRRIWHGWRSSRARRPARGPA